MFTPARLLAALVVTYVVIFLAISTFSNKAATDGSFLKGTSDGNEIFTEGKVSLNTKTQPTKRTSEPKKRSSRPEATIRMNPFVVLGAYPDPSKYMGAGKKPTYNKPHFGIINDDDYCNQVDLYNLRYPNNMFKKKNFFTDFVNGSMVRSKVMKKVGTVYMQQVSRTMPKDLYNSRLYPMEKKITLFQLQSDVFYKYHEIGKHFLCATQMFNHIPNHTTLVRKDQVLNNIHDYSLKYKGRPECFDKKSFFPETYRLFDEEECKEFFEVLESEAYKEALKREPIQYLIKIGHGAHKAQGVFLLDKNETISINKDFAKGKKCGKVNKPLIAQKYINNPMLLDNNNKFHLRVYVLVASTNPFIAYYHDGYLRAAIFPFNKNSDDRATHLTNLLMGDQVAEAANTGNSMNPKTKGMTAKELEDYYLWSFEQLEAYLIESGKTTDKNWLNNHLRPALQKAFVHVVRMTGGYFWKGSNVYELFGCDFMLDDEMGVWFIEANPNPLMDGPKPKMISQMLRDLYEIQYAYYRSRMTRIIDVIHRMQKDTGNGAVKNLEQWQEKYQEAAKNRLEPEFRIKDTNTWKLILDESKTGAEAYQGWISEECI